MNGVEVLKPEMKTNNVLWLDDVYAGKRNMSKILTMIKAGIWDSELSKYTLEHKEPVFELWHETTKDFTQVSTYTEGDFYDWHKDAVQTPCLITFLLMICKEPNKFTGGDFKLKFEDKQKQIPFKNNTAIVFPSRSLHTVTPIHKLNKEFMDNRFTIQNWAHLSA